MAEVISIDRESPVPPYEQIRAGLADRISRGELEVGTRLPTIRELADQLGLATNTVARAYHELEGAGFVKTRGRAGTFVHTDDKARARVERAARAYAEVVRSTGVGVHEAVRLFRVAHDGW
jgi:DNA-binding transcriptional regulator YhcF (GntR family)